MLLKALLFVLPVVLAVALRRLMGGIVEGLSGRTPRGGVPGRGVQMVRDPVCGTFVIPDRAVTLREGARELFFCSADCRDKHRARTA